MVSLLILPRVLYRVLFYTLFNGDRNCTGSFIEERYPISCKNRFSLFLFELTRTSYTLTRIAAKLLLMLILIFLFSLLRRMPYLLRLIFQHEADNSVV